MERRGASFPKARVSYADHNVSRLILATILVAYNNLLNLWPVFHRWGYLPANVLAGCALAFTALGPLGLDLPVLGVRRPEMLLVGAALGIVAATPLYVLLYTSFGTALLADQRFRNDDLSQLAFRMLVRIPLGTAAFEELAFRGVLLALWLPYGEFEAIAATSVAFGLWHIAPTLCGLRVNRVQSFVWPIIGAVVLTTFAGMFLAYLRVATGSLWAPIALHAVVNSLGTLAAFLANRVKKGA